MTVTGTTEGAESGDIETTVLSSAYEWMEISDRVRELQLLLGINADGVYGRGTRQAHAEENEERGLGVGMLPVPPVEIGLIGGGFLVPGFDYVVSGSGLAPGSIAEVWLYSEPTRLGQSVASAQGTVGINVVIPEDTPHGDHQLELNGTDFDGQAFVVSTPVVIGIDLESPWLSSLSLSTESVDVTYGDASFTATVVAGDDGAGIGGMSFQMDGDSDCPGWDPEDLSTILPYSIDVGFQPDDQNRLELVSGDTYNGIWEATVTIPAGLGECQLHVSLISITDALSQNFEFRAGLYTPSEIMDELGFTLPTLNITRTDVPPETTTTTTTTTAAPTTTVPEETTTTTAAE
jgi:hypothetical protein